VSGQNTTLVINNGGTELNLTGALSSDEKSMTGSYTGPGGGCFTTPTSGTWTASLIPPLNGNFSGEITESTYMSVLVFGTISNTSQAPSIPVSGTVTQLGGPGSSNATLSGTISAVGYPCFSTATFTGTISGQNVYISIFGYNSQQIGTVGVLPAGPATPGIPAIVTVDQTGGVSLVAGSATDHVFFLGSSAPPAFGPCPPLQSSDSGTVPWDIATMTLRLSSASNF
jgi:hypothetical protein